MTVKLSAKLQMNVLFLIGTLSLSLFLLKRVPPSLQYSSSVSHGTSGQSQVNGELPHDHDGISYLALLDQDYPNQNKKYVFAVKHD